MAISSFQSLSIPLLSSAHRAWVKWLRANLLINTYDLLKDTMSPLSDICKLPGEHELIAKEPESGPVTRGAAARDHEAAAKDYDAAAAQHEAASGLGRALPVIVLQRRTRGRQVREPGICPMRAVS